MARSSYSDSNFSRKVELKNADGTPRPGEFWLIRKAKNKTRVISVGDTSGSGELVDTNLIVREWEHKPETPAQPATQTPEANAAVPEQPPQAVETSSMTPAQIEDAVLDGGINPAPEQPTEESTREVVAVETTEVVTETPAEVLEPAGAQS
jgi:hypothetical protein